jgi:hypothetical protein
MQQEGGLFLLHPRSIVYSNAALHLNCIKKRTLGVCAAQPEEPMSPRPPVPLIEVPEHQLGAILLVLLTRAPSDSALRAALQMADNAAIAAWALRPDDIITLTVDQYRQLLDYIAAAQVLDLALYLGGDRKQIRTLVEHITREVAEFHLLYPPPPTSES